MSQWNYAQGGTNGQRQVTNAGGFDKGPMPVFKPGVKELFISSKSLNKYARILPDFDFNTHGTPAFSTSTVPSHDFDNPNNDGTPQKSGFYAYLRVYEFFGKGKISFISPITYNLMPGLEIDDELKHDPIQTIRDFCKKSDNPEWKELSERKVKDGKFDKDYFPYPSLKVILNLAFVDAVKGNVADPDKDVGIVMLAFKGFEDTTLAQIDTPATRNSKALTDGRIGVEYLLGDVTAKGKGVAALMSDKVKAGNNESKGLIFTENQFSQDRLVFATIDDKVLAKRRVLLSSDTLNIPTPQQIVNFLVKDRTFPYALIVEALEGFNLTIPPEPGHAAEHQGDVNPEQSTPKAPGAAKNAAARYGSTGGFSSTEGAAPSAPAPAAPTATASTPPVSKALAQASTREFWINDPNAGPAGRSVTEAGLITVIELGEFKDDVLVVDKADASQRWVAAYTVVPSLRAPKAAPAAPKAPAAPAAPAAPKVPAAPSAPAAAAAPAVGGVVSAGPEATLDGVNVDETYLNTSTPKYKAAPETPEKAEFRGLSMKLLVNETLTADQDARYNQLAAVYQ